ncbi:SRPBCC domain-containing protein [Streptomyces sp. NPDC047108]|uniref:SRPBCC domain-containing protein n=1 Tax=Streptomyces sp. NPDC047108 TaxID=3155025 RepID=UPI0033F3C0D5
MEHEVFVPFSVGTVRQALADPARVSRCIPGFQSDAEDARGTHDAPGGPLEFAGRLRLRIGHSTITYRGSLRVTEQDGGDLSVEGEGTESRGSGSVKVALNVRLSSADGGTRVTCTGTVRSEGRLAESGESAATAAGHRLLDRFAGELASGLESSPIGSSDPGDDNQRVIPGIPSPDKPDRGHAGDRRTEKPKEQEGSPETEADEGTDRRPDEGKGKGAADTGPGTPSETPSVFETEVPPPSLDPLSDLDDDEHDAGDDESVRALQDDAEDAFEEDIDDGPGTEPPAEAAHARRTMIGRSAEEVDHAPPRGRYAPVPAPEATATTVPLRWAAPAAAALVASAVVVSRILRRRR